LDGYTETSLISFAPSLQLQTTCRSDVSQFKLRERSLRRLQLHIPVFIEDPPATSTRHVRFSTLVETRAPPNFQRTHVPVLAHCSWV